MGFSRQEYWNGLSFPSPGDLPNPGIEPAAPAASPAMSLALQTDSLLLSHWGSPGIKIARRNINNLRHAGDTTLMEESEEELKSLLMKEESEKTGLKHNIQKTKVMASRPITSWQIEGEKVKAVTDFISLGSKITADSDCSHDTKRHLLIVKKAMTNLDSILKSRHITLPTKSI